MFSVILPGKSEAKEPVQSLPTTPPTTPRLVIPTTPRLITVLLRLTTTQLRSSTFTQLRSSTLRPTTSTKPTLMSTLFTKPISTTKILFARPSNKPNFMDITAKIKKLKIRIDNLDEFFILTESGFGISIFAGVMVIVLIVIKILKKHGIIEYIKRKRAENRVGGDKNKKKSRIVEEEERRLNETAFSEVLDETPDHDPNETPDHVNPQNMQVNIVDIEVRGINRNVQGGSGIEQGQGDVQNIMAEVHETSKQDKKKPKPPKPSPRKPSSRNKKI